MQFVVTFKDFPGMTVEVEAPERWDAIVKAAEATGLDKVSPMGYISERCSVRRADVKKTLGRPAREKLSKDKEEALAALKERYRNDMLVVAGEACPFCSKKDLLVVHHWDGGSINICRKCNTALDKNRVLGYFKAFPPVEVQKAFIRAMKRYEETLWTSGFDFKGSEVRFDGLLKEEGIKLGVDPFIYKRDQGEYYRTVGYVRRHKDKFESPKVAKKGKAPSKLGPSKE
jgi:hypothetical protein